MERRAGQLFEYALLAVLMFLFMCILASMVLANPAADIKPTISGWGGTVLAMIGMVVSFFFGSSKGSRLKDDGGKTVEINNSTVASTVAGAEPGGAPKP